MREQTGTVVEERRVTGFPAATEQERTTGCEFCQSFEPLDVVGENGDMRGQFLRACLKSIKQQVV